MLYADKLMTRYRILCDHILAKVFNLRLVTELKMPFGFSVNADTDEEWVVSAVCEVTELTPDRWDKLSLPSRVPWLERTLEELGKQLIAAAYTHAGPTAKAVAPLAKKDGQPAGPPAPKVLVQPGTGDLPPWDDFDMRDEMQDTAYQLVMYMWKKKWASYRGLAADVWQEDYVHFTDPAVDGVLNEANAFLSGRCARRLSRRSKEQTVIWAPWKPSHKSNTPT